MEQNFFRQRTQPLTGWVLALRETPVAAQPIPSEENHHCHLLSEIVSKALNSPCGAIFWVRWPNPPTHGLQIGARHGIAYP
uniref:Uncharacterized protein n=1 Tax=mine drainage metagenome TaxID=410659 RepID=E6Q8W9_9ZZZZ